MALDTLEASLSDWRCFCLALDTLEMIFDEREAGDNDVDNDDDVDLHCTVKMIVVANMAMTTSRSRGR